MPAHAPLFTIGTEVHIIVHPDYRWIAGKNGVIDALAERPIGPSRSCQPSACVRFSDALGDRRWVPVAILRVVRRRALPLPVRREAMSLVAARARCEHVGFRLRGKSGAYQIRPIGGGDVSHVESRAEAVRVAFDRAWREAQSVPLTDLEQYRALARA